MASQGLAWKAQPPLTVLESPGLPDKKPIVESCQAWVCTLLQLALSGMGPALVIQTEEMLISKVLCLFLNHKLVEEEET